MDGLTFERQLYLVRRTIEHGTKDIADFYIPTFSSRLISYKGLAMPATLRAFYLDMQNPDFETAIAVYHQRFSTNTFPLGRFGQPFRMMAHNGEINTVSMGNRNWMTSREEFFESEVWGEDIDLVKDLVSDNESDSASLDHCLELLTLSGRDIEHAMCMLVPPAYRNDNEISEDLYDFYRYHRSFAEPCGWTGRFGLHRWDQNLALGLDRNGLRPSRYALFEDGLLYIGSEIGCIECEETKAIAKGRLGPWQTLVANTATGKLELDLRVSKNALPSKLPTAAGSTKTKCSLRNMSHTRPLCPPKTPTPSPSLANRLPTPSLRKNSTW